MFSTFCLDATGGAQKWKQTQMAPPVLPAYARQQSLQHLPFTYFVPSSVNSFLFTTFSNPHVIPSGVANDSRCIPLFFFY
jgi:hypothetical protein